MASFGKIMSAFVLGLALQGGIYYYLDQIYFAPTTDFEVTASDGQEKDGNFPDVGEGNKYYSQGHKYMAVVTQDSVKVYTSGEKTPTDIDLKGRQVSYFEWLPDRDLAIMGLYGGVEDNVVLARFDPESPEHEVDTTMQDLPSDSKIVDAAFSTATNVVYMKIKVAENAYRIYRTDANYDTRRVYMQASNIGRIAVFYDEDIFFYDNVRTGDVFMFDGTEGGWRVINPAGRYRLIGVDKDKDIYIAKVDEDDKALSVLQGRLGVGFETVDTFSEPQELKDITVASIEKMITDKRSSDNKKQ
ncbi:hypothetical protein [Veillonella criceti]|uniref:Uncharacterized protein n=1 Tax=Veillonella criceti TaxID=103891 RepID=A0A380NKI0_9FIRM|nr:hypothetical protein [Veillonella criceti]SUP43171.1 Uncharacterised protein [Veillonella criceti]